MAAITMKTIICNFLFALTLAASTNAAPALRGLARSCNSECSAVFTTCIRAPGADKSVCRTAKKACQLVCKTTTDVSVPLEDVDQVVDDTEKDVDEIVDEVEDVVDEVVDVPKVESKGKCVSTCAKVKNACMKAATSKEKKECMPIFKTCKEAC
ncbi:hypothetical protein MPSEU_000047900 [Mayamaea pseudoterrestris]|nr:hypothetical protein MPSEU_000047900 [Mayamaea pseudoterrestris]